MIAKPIKKLYRYKIRCWDMNDEENECIYYVWALDRFNALTLINQPFNECGIDMPERIK